MAFCKERVDEQLQAKVPKSDIIGRLIASSRSRNALSQERPLLDGDTIAGLIAGSDTTPCLLVYTLTHLAKTPAYQERLLDELNAHGVEDPWETKAVQNLPFLNALLNESLRLHNPLPTGTPRDTGSEGVTIGGKYIPPNTIVVAPRWNIARSPTVFSEPATFMPQRWLPGCAPEIHDTRGFMPFGAGRYQCIGRNLALSQARRVIAVLVSCFEISLAEGEFGEKVDEEMIDHFTAVPGPVKLSFQRRDM
ncbi:MAG: hypothetical protein M1821_000049 [Bathelium mastoideum]|nr:MAG: hypothetical protein M1821_000049 [Bathelium mastoideum]